jgi:hypothetical protein
MPFSGLLATGDPRHSLSFTGRNFWSPIICPTWAHFLGRLVQPYQATSFGCITLLCSLGKPLRGNVNLLLAAGANNLDLQCKLKSFLGLLTVGSQQPPTVIRWWTAYSLLLAAARPITKFQLRPQLSREEPCLLALLLVWSGSCSW